MKIKSYYYLSGSAKEYASAEPMDGAWAVRFGSPHYRKVRTLEEAVALMSGDLAKALADGEIDGFAIGKEAD